LFQRKLCRNERAAVGGGFAHQHTQRQPTNDPIPSWEMMTVRWLTNGQRGDDDPMRLDAPT